jgi:hypothetical protein
MILEPEAAAQEYWRPNVYHRRACDYEAFIDQILHCEENRGMVHDLLGNLSVEGKGLTQRKLVQIIVELVSEKPRLNAGAPLLAEVTCLHAELVLRDLREKQSNQGRIGCHAAAECQHPG